MKPSKQMAHASGAAFIVLCIFAWGAWEVQSRLNTLRAWEVPAERVEIVAADGTALFHLKRDASITRDEEDMARLPDEIFIMQLAMMGMGALALIAPFFVMGKLARRKP